MQKKSMRNDREANEKLWNERITLVRVAMDKGCSSRQAISKATGLTLVQLHATFYKDTELYAEFKILRRTIVDSASDSLHEMVENRQHPNHFQAVKHVLSKYKSDLDDSLESHDSEGISVEIEGDGKSKNPIVIKFAKNKE